MGGARNLKLAGEATGSKGQGTGGNNFYARKQLLLSALLSHRNSVRPSVRPSVCLSHGWISQKRCKL